MPDTVGFIGLGNMGGPMLNNMLVQTNLVAVCEVDTPPGAERSLLGFETLTVVPIDHDVVDLGLMTPGEIQWLDAYHARVRQILMPLVDGAVALGLDAATRPLNR